MGATLSSRRIVWFSSPDNAMYAKDGAYLFNGTFTLYMRQTGKRGMMQFQGMNPDDARVFADKWLPAWTGNRPELLAAFYTPDVVYSDPAIPQGLRGREALLAYFRKLLARNPEWVWSHRGSIPMEDGFLNLWHASIPVGERSVESEGVCTVQLRDGLIYANHVFFDPSELLKALSDS